jgi:hypothetical protein
MPGICGGVTGFGVAPAWPVNAAASSTPTVTTAALRESRRWRRDALDTVVDPFWRVTDSEKEDYGVICQSVPGITGL